MSVLSVSDVQPIAMRILQAATERGRVSHAYLFHGPGGTGKWQAALTLTRWLLCPQKNFTAACDCSTCRRIDRYQHPDVHWVLPLVTSEKTASEEKKAAEETAELLDAKRADPWAALVYPRRPYITTKRIRKMQAVLARTAMEGGKKISIIANAEYLRPDVQSILLKTIEEPPRDTHLIVTTNEKSSLLDTILSRCQPVRFAPLPDEVLMDQIRHIEGAESDISLAVALAGGSLTRARDQMTEEGILWRKTAWAILRTAVLGTAEELLAQFDEVFRQRPDIPTLRRCVDIWDFGIHQALTQAGHDKHREDRRSADAALLACYRRLAPIRSELNNNVTPKVALAAALLDVQTRLVPFRREAAEWFPSELTVLTATQPQSATG